MAPNEKLKIQSFLLIPLLFSIFGHALNADAADLVTSTQHLKDGETVRTEDGSFELGFFSPANSNDRYVGIWFASIPQQTVVWVANRENPVKNSSGVFRIGKDGNLVVLDGHDNILWSSNVSTASNNSVGELLDNGNLILRSGDSADTGNFLWQSFDHPSDTFLPGMKFGMNLKTNQSQLLKAWKNSDNPSAGEFSLGFDPDGTAQIIIWNGTKRHYRSGQWNGQGFGGIPDMTSYHYYGFTVVSDKDEGRLYCIYSNPNKTVLSSFVLNPYGKLDRTYLFDRTSSWKLAWSGPNSECETYGTCGSNGVCNENRSPLCGCLKGFVPSSPQDWKAGNWSGGCVRQKPLPCNEDGISRNDGFLKISGVKLPDFARPVALEGQGNCTEMCKMKCSCIAFSYDIGLGCLTWHGDLEDLQMFKVGGQDLYLRLDKSYLRGMHKVKMAISILAILLGVILMVFSTIFMCRRIARNKDSGKEGSNKKLQFLDMEKKLMNSDRQYDHLDGIELEVGVNNANSPEVPLFSLDFVRFATDDFSMANKLGEGGFGPVYKGKLPNGQEIAVKRLSKVSGQGLQEFRNEVILIAKLQHRNLVRLLGYCIQGEEKLLIYEYMPNKSLDAFLFDPIKKAELDWRKRFDIIEGIARGLLYLHRDSRLRIIHRDLKASNILLDVEMNPKISDFGTARIFGGKDHQENTVRVVGTYGYMAPEYAMEGLLSLKSDVFSFGVLLLEIVSGKRNANFYHPEKPMNLLGYAWELWQEDKMLQFVDPSLGESYLGDQVSRCIQVGFLCVQDNTTDRPTMDSAVFMLGSEATVLPTPKKPSFSMGRTPRETDEQGFSSGNCSANAVTMTKLLGR